MHPPCVWIMTAGFTGRCRGDEERRAPAHATKRCWMGSGSYDNNDKLGLTGQHDDGPPRTLRRAARPRPPSGCRVEFGCLARALAAIWRLSNSQSDDMKRIVRAHRVSIRYLKKKKKDEEEEEQGEVPPNPPGWMEGGGGLGRFTL